MTKKLKMLVVDDEIGVLKLLKDVFSLRGWDVLTTPTGTSTQPLIEKEDIDIVLLDIRLPDGSGLDILKDIKNRYSHIPVIIFTACGYEDELVNMAIRLGASGYVSKSVPITELIEAVNNTLVK